jgi:hypothetical protein
MKNNLPPVDGYVFPNPNEIDWGFFYWNQMCILVLGVSHGIDDCAQRNDNEGENILIQMKDLSDGVSGACYSRSYLDTAVIAGDDEDGDHAQHGAADPIYSGFCATGLRMN